MSISVSADGLSAIVGVNTDTNSTSTSIDLKRYTRQSTSAVFGNMGDLLGGASLNTSDNEWQGRLSRDALSLFFTRFVSSNSTVYLAQRSTISASFTGATALDAATVNIATNSGSAWQSPDNKNLWWIANFALYHAEVTTTGYVGTAAATQVNSIGEVRAPAFTDDVLTLYLASKGGSTATVFDTEQIWRSTRPNTSSLWSVPTVVDELRDSTIATFPQDVSPDGCIIYLAKGSTTVRHLYQAVRPR